MTKLEKIQNYIQDRIELLERRHDEAICYAKSLHADGNHTDEEFYLQLAQCRHHSINELKWLQQHIKEMK